MPFESYLTRGLLKRQRVSLKQIETQLVRANKDLHTASRLLRHDSEWASTIAYQAMLRAGRALVFSRGYLPADGAQHRTVVELTHHLLGPEYAALVQRFEIMRRKRNLFFYESDPFGTLTEAQNALKAATKLVRVIQKTIQRRSSQHHFDFT